MKWFIRESYWQQDINNSEYILAATKAVAMVGFISYLFFHSLLAVIFLMPIAVWYWKGWREECIYRKKQQFRSQFQDAMQAMSLALTVGYSMENAIRETRKDLSVIYTAKEKIIRELSYMEHQLNINVTVEEILQEFGERVEQEDVRNFVSVFITAKRSGGDVISILQNAVNQISDKVEVQKEIHTIMAAKKLEFKVMTMIPFVILVYMRLSFPEFMEVLYGNPLGVTIMSICLIIYLASYELGRSIVKIEV